MFKVSVSRIHSKSSVLEVLEDPPYNHEDLGLGLQHSCEKPDKTLHTWHHGSEETETEDPTAHWPAGHAECVSSD